VDLHLDDRLLHGRILHGWGRVLKPRRYVLVSERLADPELCGLHAEAAEANDAQLCCIVPGEGMPPSAREGDFWLTDAPAAALWLLDVDRPFERLIVIGLREATGPILPDGNRIGEESLARLGELSVRAVNVELRAFPAETPRALPSGNEKP
jgi:mannose/fructose/N-acetylgalactosamine-specific phosphotransferase system component IIB